jgi:sulfur carrier protein ThiS
MNVYIEKDNKNLKLELDNVSGLKLLERLKINSSSIILVRNNEVVLEDEILSDKDDVKILSVVSGG